MSTPTPDRFPPHGTVSSEQLKAYAAGRLDAASAHAVEVHLEADPLLREALEGLRLPGAIAMLERLPQHRPGGTGFPIGAWIAGGMVLATLGGALWWSINSGTDRSPVPAAKLQPIIAPTAPTPAMSSAPLADAEIDAAVELPETLLIGHAATDRHALDMRTEAVPVLREHVDPIAPRATTVDHGATGTIGQPKRAAKPSLQLLYLHDLKLVHPQELYARDPLLLAEAGSVSAQYADRQQKTTSAADQRSMVYTTFMDEALEKFSRNDHKGCLEDLRFLLDQYPDDVNALFYAGLCCYNLGLNERARTFLHRAATHPVAVFDEEAVWYHALTLDRLGEQTAATESYQRIAAQGGFYAARAQAKLGSGNR